jgi:hypothetical protein
LLASIILLAIIANNSNSINSSSSGSNKGSSSSNLPGLKNERLGVPTLLFCSKSVRDLHPVVLSPVHRIHMIYLRSSLLLFIPSLLRQFRIRAAPG